MAYFALKSYAIIGLVVSFILLANLLRIQHNITYEMDTFTNYGTFIQPKRDNFVEDLELKNKIVMATVICSKAGDESPREEAAVMIKSVIISSKLYSSETEFPPVTWAEFHIFLEHNNDVDWILWKLEEFGYPFVDLKIDLYFHSATQVIPDEYQKFLVNDKNYRCMYTRHFLSHELKDVDTILYVDTDVIFTGNIRELWLKKDEMNGEQLIAAIGDYHGEAYPTASQLFVDIPFPPPKGINSGVLLMKLDKMRQVRWEERLLRAYQDYAPGRKLMNDQKLANILLYFDPGTLLQLPCQFNFWSSHCFRYQSCPEAERNPKGIQVLHGATSSFEKQQPFREIFVLYQNISLKRKDLDFMTHLMVPIREAYNWRTDEEKKEIKIRTGVKMVHGKCDGYLNKLLFKNYFDDFNGK